MRTMHVWMVLEGFYERSEAMLGTKDRQTRALQSKAWTGLSAATLLLKQLSSAQ